jgi:hypothetical protein
MTRFPLILAVLLFAILPSMAAAQPAAEAVVREDVRALTEADAAALLALFDENSVIFGLPDHPDRLAGPVSPRIGTHALRQSAFPAMLPAGRRTGWRSSTCCRRAGWSSPSSGSPRRPISPAALTR